jgi:hypothetical protein
MSNLKVIVNTTTTDITIKGSAVTIRVFFKK